ncbi:MAG TPA: MBL fold metallo-hydrolase [Syntrophorhabdaceae bacterium]|nr:MBL fold metallo-hydrolase [Syntrophorhabdaceae bacterium]
MIEKIASDLFRIEIPLPDLLLKFVNSYVIKDPVRNLVIDTGMYNDECLDTMVTSLRKLDVDLLDTDFFITHSHGDHIGLVSRLMQNGSAVYMNKAETELIRKIGDGSLSEEIRSFLVESDFPEKDPSKILPRRVRSEFSARTALSFQFLKDGDVLKKGSHEFRCVETPGHSNGHMCLYDLTSKYLIAGDHLLGNITPGIQARIDTQNPLKEYLASLRKIYALDVSKVLPGHRDVFENFRSRIVEIEEHHEQRNKEALEAMIKGGRTVYEIASKMTWNVDCDSWDSFPVVQSFFATSETFAHLRYLEENGSITRSVREGKLFYEIAARNN